MSILDPDGELQALERGGLRRQRRVLGTPQGVRVEVDGRPFVSFASNDYLGLAADQRLVEALCEGAHRHGVGAGASHLLTGHHRVHQQAEDRLARFARFPRALLFGSGYSANLAAVSVLASAPRTALFADRLNHASLNDAMVLSRARFRRYPHLDLGRLSHWLAQSKASNRVVLTDAVFSMDGDVAPLADLWNLCQRYEAWLLVDDAHGFGLLGPHGAGAAAHFGLAGDRLVYVGTLGKAIGVSGAFVAASQSFIELLVQKGRPYVYSTAPPPALAHALLVSLEIVEREDWRRDRLQERIGQLRGLLGGTGRLWPSGTAIQPWVIGDGFAALEVAARLAQAGLLVPAIRPPTVPAGTARLRISLSSAHREQDVQHLAAVLLSLSLT